MFFEIFRKSDPFGLDPTGRPHPSAVPINGGPFPLWGVSIDSLEQLMSLSFHPILLCPTVVADSADASIEIIDTADSYDFDSQII